MSADHTEASDPNETQKLIVTNRSALRAKYGAGADAILAAVDELVEADGTRGVPTRVLALDDPQEMESVGAAAVEAPDDASAVKAAVDAAFEAVEPDYLMVLGSIDVVPHQPIANTMPDDGDELVPSDLPYACDAPFDDDVQAFVGPTRVVARLPDLTAATEPGYLVGLLKNATSWDARPVDDYRPHLGITAKVWEGSTSLSLQNLFGSSDALRRSPTEGPRWPPDLLGRLTHFINCHGAEADSHFYGQEGGQFPVSHDAVLVSGKVSSGTVAAAECCYGAELFDPALTQGQSGIAAEYLGSGAYGFLGSSTIAYGPAEGNGSADLMCQFFIRSVLQGASLGRALLEARQEFVRAAPVMGPADLKTLAQFNLLADPSIHPVLPQRDETIPLDVPMARSVPPLARTLLTGRAARRANLAAIGLALLEATASIRPAGEPASEDVVESILRAASEPGLRPAAVRSFTVEAPRLASAGRRARPAAERVHVVVARPDRGSAPPRVARIVVVEATERSNAIQSVRTLYAR
jgi:hypothetical protein